MMPNAVTSSIYALYIKGVQNSTSFV